MKRIDGTRGALAATTIGALLLAGTGPSPVVDGAIVLGLAVVVPLALGEARGAWVLAAAGAAVGTRVGPGPLAAVGALPGIALAARATLDRVRARASWAALLVPVWAGAACGALGFSLAGWTLLDVREPIVRLTTVHYLYAGVGALTVAHRLAADRPRPRRLATIAVVLTALAPPVVASGFFLDHPVPQVGGAVLMTLGVWASSLLLLDRARRAGPGARRALAAVAGVAAWGPMVLAVAWATAQHVPGVPSLSIPDMARTHGLANGLGFVLAGLLATRPVPPPGAAEAAGARTGERAPAPR